MGFFEEELRRREREEELEELRVYCSICGEWDGLWIEDTDIADPSEYVCRSCERQREDDDD